MKHFLFVIPNAYNSRTHKQEQRKCIPYGVLSIATYVEHYCPAVQCDVLDLNLYDGWPQQRQVLLERLNTTAYDLVGISSMFSTVKAQTAQIAAEVRKNASVGYITVGGIAASNSPEMFFSEMPEIDAICCGEGEIPFLDLAMAESFEAVFRTHRGWLTKEALAAGKTPEPVYVADLDDIPVVNYDKVPVEAYGSRIRDDGGSYRQSLPIHTTRGCPYSCVFCCAGANHGRRVRAMSAQRVIEDITYLKEHYGIEKISIDDDQFLCLKDRAKQVLRGLVPLNLELEFASGLNVKFIDEEIASALRQAGAKTVVIAVESGSQRVLDEIIHKPLELCDVAQCVDWLHRYGIRVDAFIIVGLPGETPEDLEKTKQFMRTANIDWYIINVAQPYPGSQLYEQCSRNGWLLRSDENGNDRWSIEPEPGFAQRMQQLRYSLKVEMNYLNNYSLRNRDFGQALQIFKNTADVYPNHAISQYCVAMAYRGMENFAASKTYFERFLSALERRPAWNEYVKDFALHTHWNAFLQEAQNGNVS